MLKDTSRPASDRAIPAMPEKQGEWNMNEKLNVRLGSPVVVMFFWSFAMLLVGIVFGE
jgi:hypothetical protein